MMTREELLDVLHDAVSNMSDTQLEALIDEAKALTKERTVHTLTRTNDLGEVVAMKVYDTTVSIGGDDEDGPFENVDAFVDAEYRWNGFVIPYFTKFVADGMVARAKECPPAFASYDEATDTYGFGHEDIEREDWDVTTGEDWTMENGDVIRLYSIGGMCWCWDDVNETEGK